MSWWKTEKLLHLNLRCTTARMGGASSERNRNMMKHLYIHWSSSIFKAKKVKREKERLGGKALWEEVDGKIAYVLWWSTRLDISGVWPHKHEVLEAIEEVVIIDANLEPEPLQDPKDQSKKITGEPCRRRNRSLTFTFSSNFLHLQCKGT